MQEGRFDPWVRKIPWRREWLPTSVFLPGESHGQRSLVGYSPWGLKASDAIEQLTLSQWSPGCQPKRGLSLWVGLLCVLGTADSPSRNVSSPGLWDPTPTPVSPGSVLFHLLPNLPYWLSSLHLPLNAGLLQAFYTPYGVAIFFGPSLNITFTPGAPRSSPVKSSLLSSRPAIWSLPTLPFSLGGPTRTYSHLQVSNRAFSAPSINMPLVLHAQAQRMVHHPELQTDNLEAWTPMPPFPSQDGKLPKASFHLL